MLWQDIQIQIEKFSQFVKNESVNIEEFTVQPKFPVSLSKKLAPLKILGSRSDFYLEAPTSGESSPCLSESGKTPRFNAPSVFDIQKTINHEEITDFDYDIEKISSSDAKCITLFIEGLDEFLTSEDLNSLMDEIKVGMYSKSDIFVITKSKFMKHKEKRCLALTIVLKNSKIFARYIRKFQMHFKNTVGYGIGLSTIKINKKTSSNLNGVVVRNIPPNITSDELKEKCIEEINGAIQIGPIQRIKEKNCCFVECDCLEDAEVICKKINRTKVRDIETKESFVIKVIFLKD